MHGEYLFGLKTSSKMQSSSKRQKLEEDLSEKSNISRIGLAPNVATQNQSNGNDDNNDKSKPEEQTILPEELWEDILSRLENPKDLFSISKICQQFERIVEPSKNNWLFFEVFPMIFPYLSKKDILGCRLVSKMWKCAVDNLMENHSSTRPFDAVLDTSTNPLSYHYYPKLEQKGFGPLTLSPYPWGGLTPRKLLDKMNNHQGFPFKIRNLRSMCSEYKLKRRYWNNIFTFLKRFGAHVWTLELVFEDSRKDMISFYKIVRRCLQLTPNLKTIELSIPNHLLFVPYQQQCYMQDFCMRQVILKYQLPKLHQLSSILVLLKDQDVSSTKLLVLDEIFRRYAQQVKMVKMYADIFDEKRLRTYFWNTNHLTEMYLISDSAPTSSQTSSNYFSNNLEIILSATPNNTSLAKISVDIKRPLPPESVLGILNLLKKFTALRHFKMILCDSMPPFISSPQIGNPIRLTSVKTFEIMFRDFGFFHDSSLSYFPNLEYMIINKKCKTLKGGKEVKSDLQ